MFIDNMATKKGRTPKLDEKKGKKSEDPTPVEDKKDPDDVATTEGGPTPEIEEPPPKEPTPEPVYDEPTLTELIVER